MDMGFLFPVILGVIIGGLLFSKSMRDGLFNMLGSKKGKKRSDRDRDDGERRRRRDSIVRITKRNGDVVEMDEDAYFDNY